MQNKLERNQGKGDYKNSSTFLANGSMQSFEKVIPIVVFIVTIVTLKFSENAIAMCILILGFTSLNITHSLFLKSYPRLESKMELYKTVLNALIFALGPYYVPGASYFWLLALLPLYRIGAANLNTAKRRSYLWIVMGSTYVGIYFSHRGLEEALLPCIILLLITILNRSVANDLHRNFLELESVKDRLYLNARMTTASSVASGLAHEINNPINLINGSSLSIQNILKKVINNSGELTLKNHKDINVFVDIIKRSSERTFEIVDRMGRHNPSSSLYELAELNVDELIKDVVTISQRKVANIGIDLILACPDSDLKVKGHAGNLGQVILSFINNAYDSFTTENDKWIKITVSKLHGMIYLRFTDSTNGEKNLFKNNILEPFTMIHGAGSGEELGLSLCQTIVNEHYGQVYLNEIGEYTEFVIELPLCQKVKPVEPVKSTNIDLAWV
jgi:signal transduction histidine kinase